MDRSALRHLRDVHGSPKCIHNLPGGMLPRSIGASERARSDLAMKLLEIDGCLLDEAVCACMMWREYAIHTDGSTSTGVSGEDVLRSNAPKGAVGAGDQSSGHADLQERPEVFWVQMLHIGAGLLPCIL